MKLDIVDLFEKSVKNYQTGKIPVVLETDAKGQSKHNFSTKELLTDIDLAFNSIYKDGKIGKDKKRKMYLNIVRFYWEVATKNTNVKISNYVFTPVDYSKENIWAVWFFARQFATFVKDSGYGDTIVALNGSLRKYGSAISKKVGEDISVVPLQSISLDQKAQTIMEGIDGGTPFIEEHEYSYKQIRDFPDWDVPEEFKGKRRVLEGYTYLTVEEYNELKGIETVDTEGVEDTDEMMLCVVIVMPSGKKEDDRRMNYEGNVLYCEEIDEIPYAEYHTGKQPWRWLGFGEVEKQLENQLARNVTVNLRRRNMEWSTKHLYQKAGDPIGKNLAMNVVDGEVLEVGINGQLSRIDTTTHALNDFQADESVWEDNSQKQAFAFEASTGESFASGTPFRMGAMLSNSVMEHFDLEKHNFTRALKESFFAQIMPIFKKRCGKDLVIIGSTDEGFEKLKEMYIEVITNKQYAAMAHDPKLLDMEQIPTIDEVRMAVEEGVTKMSHLFADVPAEIYKNAKYKIDIDIAGEDKPLADKESLTTLYTTMAQKGDPRADKVLEVLLGSMGKNLAAIAGKAPAATIQPQNPNLEGLVPQQNG
jgi:hypothetical protein